MSGISWSGVYVRATGKSLRLFRVYDLDSLPRKMVRDIYVKKGKRLITWRFREIMRLI